MIEKLLKLFKPHIVWCRTEGGVRYYSIRKLTSIGWIWDSEFTTAIWTNKFVYAYTTTDRSIMAYRLQAIRNLDKKKQFKKLKWKML